MCLWYLRAALSYALAEKVAEGARAKEMMMRSKVVDNGGISYLYKRASRGGSILLDWFSGVSILSIACSLPASSSLEKFPRWTGSLHTCVSKYQGWMVSGRERRNEALIWYTRFIDLAPLCPSGLTLWFILPLLQHSHHSTMVVLSP